MSQMTYMEVADNYLELTQSMSNQELATRISRAGSRDNIVVNYNSVVSNHLDRLNEKLQNEKFCYEKSRNARMREKLRAKLNSKK
jgi:hypothetical protein